MIPTLETALLTLLLTYAFLKPHLPASSRLYEGQALTLLLAVGIVIGSKIYVMQVHKSTGDPRCGGYCVTSPHCDPYTFWDLVCEESGWGVICDDWKLCFWLG